MMPMTMRNQSGNPAFRNMRTKSLCAENFVNPALVSQSTSNSVDAQPFAEALESAHKVRLGAGCEAFMWLSVPLARRAGILPAPDGRLARRWVP